MKKYFKLLKNTTIFFIANFSSRFLSFLLVPLYTYVLTKDEYGTVDIIVTTSTIIIPVITLSIGDAVFRFTMDKNADKRKIFSNAIFVVLIGNILLAVALFPFKNIKYISYLFFIIFFDSFNAVTLYFCYGNEFVKTFAAGSVIGTITLLSSNIVLLLKFNLGIKGYLISIILNCALPVLFFSITLKLWRYITKPDFKILKKMLSYSIFMLPNALAWFIITSSDKYCLIYFDGLTSYGLYVVAQKIPSIIQIIGSVFMMAWQISAIDNKSFEERSMFYSKIFNMLSILMLLSISLITLIIKPLYSFWLNSAYFEAWKYTTVLLFANVFSIFANFAGTSYLVMKKSHGNLKTTVIGCFTNMILNLIFIPKFGIFAASVSTMISFEIVWIIRIMDTRYFVRYSLNIKKMLLIFTIIMFQFFMLFINDNILIQISCSLAVLLIYERELTKILYNIKIVLYNKIKQIRRK